MPFQKLLRVVQCIQSDLDRAACGEHRIELADASHRQSADAGDPARTRQGRGTTIKRQRRANRVQGGTDRQVARFAGLGVAQPRLGPGQLVGQHSALGLPGAQALEVGGLDAALVVDEQRLAIAFAGNATPAAVQAGDRSRGQRFGRVDVVALKTALRRNRRRGCNSQGNGKG
ncbi:MULTISPECIES: hypothetical protein [Mameliella]|uniref:hypothetical protein n=1 Tax=Mameliella TaxID=1434019 RepID=UPI000B52FD11|nr:MULTISPECIES: hypothetical protein [Mameliella]MCR9273870.1 hypothetical protein [Paracoccaceae bacterium]OWV62119.1 hypothetical protein CDZ98_06465 [Mameliella alba]